VFVVNGHTDDRLLQDTFADAAAAAGTAGVPRVFRLDSLGVGAMRALLDALADAAHGIAAASARQPRGTAVAPS
jgi:hypothetical protein